ncbi:hypothetical protein J3F83DRAFT_749211 [Trichoderma novae-zelandiae]
MSYHQWPRIQGLGLGIKASVCLPALVLSSSSCTAAQRLMRPNADHGFVFGSHQKTAARSWRSLLVLSLTLLWVSSASSIRGTALSPGAFSRLLRTPSR